MSKGKLLVGGAAGSLATVFIPLALEDDWEVLAVSRRPPDASSSPRLRYWQADLARPEEVEALFDALQGEGLVPDALAHLAGSLYVSGLAQTSAERYREVMAANLDSAFYTLRSFVGLRRKNGGGGSAVFVSSVAAKMGIASHEAVSAAKAGLEALVRSAAATHARDRIRINAVASGLMEGPAAMRLLRNSQALEAAARQYPLLGLIPREQVARALLYLLDPTNDRITGQILSVDGGFTSIRPLVTGG